MYGCLSCTPTGDQTHNLCMCPVWESNQRPFGSQAATQSNEPHQPGLKVYIYIFMSLLRIVAVASV